MPTRAAIRAIMGAGAILGAIVTAGAAHASNTAFATVTTEALPPIGWVEFCQRYRAECGGGTLRPQPMALDHARWRELLRVNSDVNRAIEPMTDLDQWGVAEQWDFPTTGVGDCEDYVLEKRRRLIALGWPRQALLITVVRDHKGEGHAVLTVRTDRGDFILDNQEPLIKRWDETGYRFIKRQSEEHQNRWVGLAPEPTRLAARRQP